MSNVGVLDKVMAVLELFEKAPSLDPRQVATATGMAPPTAYRLMKALAEHEVLQLHRGRYRLGLRLYELGSLVSQRMDLREIAREHLRALRDETTETVELQVLVGSSRVPVEMEIGSRTVRAAGQVGVPLPLHKGASSPVLLAWLEPEEALRLAAESAARAGDADWDADAYRARLEAVRAQGWAFGLGERDVETAAASAPVRDGLGVVVAALVVSGTATRFSDEEHAAMVVAAMVRTAGVMSQAIGAAGDQVAGR